MSRGGASLWILAGLGLAGLAGVAAMSSSTENFDEDEPDQPELPLMPIDNTRPLPDRPSAHFTWGEVSRSSTAERLKLDNRPTPAAGWAAVDLAQHVLQPLRNHLGRAVDVSSWYRSPAVNKAVGGAKRSDHMTGRAADIMVDGMTSTQLARVVLQLGLEFDQLIGYGDKPHLHVSWRPGGQNRGDRLWYPTKGSSSQAWRIT